MFLDISKAFDKVWHDGLIYKLMSNGIQGEALGILKSFLNDRLQRVVLNGQSSDWEKVCAGVPQGSILGPLLFLLYINDISYNLECKVKLFADDTCLFSIVNDPVESAVALNNDLSKIQQWAYQWKMEFNPDLTKHAAIVLFSCKNNKILHPQLLFNDQIVIKVEEKRLGLILDGNLSFVKHINENISIAKKNWSNQTSFKVSTTESSESNV